MKQDTGRLIESFSRLNTLVIGDVMIDTYVRGNVERISPEAPVPVVHVTGRERRLGGAANVALNIASVGASALVCSVVGADEEGAILKNLLKDNGIDTGGIITSEERVTTEKTRVVCRNHQMLRFDSEMTADISPSEEAALIERVKSLLDTQPVHVIIFQDYNKGVLTPHVIESVIALAKVKNIPTAADPKHKNFFSYLDATLFKPNLKEVNDILSPGAGISTENGSLARAAERIYKKLNNRFTLITLSDKGIFISDNRGNEQILPAHVRNIADVSGAGDTVIAIASLCLAAGSGIREMAALANIAGGLVCEIPGVAPIDKQALLSEAIKLMA